MYIYGTHSCKRDKPRENDDNHQNTTKRTCSNQNFPKGFEMSKFDADQTKMIPESPSMLYIFT